jgi:two-component system, NarL family, response regulator DesR
MISVVLAEDQHMIRGALVALLQLEPDIEVLADLERGDHVLDAVLRLTPDVVVLDIDMPGIDGITVAKLLRDRGAICQVLILTGLSQPGYLLRALESHVRGFLLKDAPSAVLANAIRRVAAGERVLDPGLVAAALETGASPLTRRETEVLERAATGLTTEQIGTELFLSPTTVRNYLSNAITKIGGANRLEAITAARRAGWIRDPGTS